MRGIWTAVIAALGSMSLTLSAQTLNVAASHFADQARDGTRRYQTQANAVADGFKRVGVEFPAMGEHWVNLQRVMEDTLVAARPSVLIYVNVRGEARLAGVAYTALLRPGESPPNFERPFWHEHNGTVADESFPLAHHLGTDASPRTGDSAALRLSILHAWVWTPNADGLFATENWVLPSLRVGSSVSMRGAHDALRGLALASDTTGYYALMIRTGAEAGGSPLTAAEERVATATLAQHHARAVKEIGLLRSGGVSSAEVTVALAETWASLWGSLERVLPARVAQLRLLREHL